MTITLEITKNIKLHLTLTYWHLFPGHEERGNSFNSVFQPTDYYSWACFRLEIVSSPKTFPDKNWSDDDVIRQMKNLEKEVETVKSKPKPSVKRK